MDAAATMLAGRTMAAAAASMYRATALALSAMIEPPRFGTGHGSRQNGPNLLRKDPEGLASRLRSRRRDTPKNAYPVGSAVETYLTRHQRRYRILITLSDELARNWAVFTPDRTRSGPGTNWSFSILAAAARRFARNCPPGRAGGVRGNGKPKGEGAGSAARRPASRSAGMLTGPASPE